MDERVMQFRVGVMVIITIVIAGILVLLFGELPAFGRGTYTIHVHFPQARGVTRDTPVRKSGLLIGRVSSVAFAEAEGVIVTAAIDEGVPLYHNEVCRVSGSLLGDAELQFVPSGDDSLPRTRIEPDELIAGIVMSDPVEVIGNIEGDLAGAITSVTRTSDEIGRLAGRAASLLENNEEQITRVVRQAETALSNIERAAISADRLLSDEQLMADLRTSITELPSVLTDARDAIGGLRSAAESADRNLKNLEGLTEPLNQRGGDLVERVDEAIGNINSLATNLASFADALSRPEGTLGQLLNNPDLYQNVNEAAENLAELTRDLRPIVDDVRVFTDKVSRHPDDLIWSGIRGKPGIK